MTLRLVAFLTYGRPSERASRFDVIHVWAGCGSNGKRTENDHWKHKTALTYTYIRITLVWIGQLPVETITDNLLKFYTEAFYGY
ncbi:hypothetical protein [Spirosoma litoris]